MRLDRRIVLRGAALLVAAVWTGVGTAADFRYSAPIVVERSAPFVALSLPASAYERSVQSELRDLRVVDARGDRVPFAIVAPRIESRETTVERRAALYPLPPDTGAGREAPLPIELTISGDRISVKRSAAADAPASTTASPGWLIDLGERPSDEPPADAIRVAWNAPSEFSAGYTFETSDDLQRWRRGGFGQLMALASAQGTLQQPRIVLPPGSGRFVRLLWSDPASAPRLTEALATATRKADGSADASTELVVAARTDRAAPAPDRAIEFELGGDLPVAAVELRLPAGNRVVPARIDGRARRDAAWRDLGSAVFYRLEREGAVSTAPAWPLHATLARIRIVPDERAGTLDPQSTRLAVRAELARIVFASQGEPPYRLLAGSADAAAGNLPAETLVPQYDDERKRFGQATLGAWSEVEAVARAADREARYAAWRPWLLWAVLGLGVAALAAMVWRLARPSR